MTENVGHLWVILIILSISIFRSIKASVCASQRKAEVFFKKFYFRIRSTSMSSKSETKKLSEPFIRFFIWTFRSEKFSKFKIIILHSKTSTF